MVLHHGCAMGTYLAVKNCHSMRCCDLRCPRTLAAHRVTWRPSASWWESLSPRRQGGLTDKTIMNNRLNGK